MARTKDPSVKARNEELYRRRREGESIPQLAEEFLLSKKTVENILRQAGVTLENRQRRIVSKTRNPLLVQIGSDLSIRRVFDLRADAKQIAVQAQISVHKLLNLERGQYDPTATELVRLADVYRVPVTELMRHRQIGEKPNW